MEVFSMVKKFGLVTVLRILQRIEENKGALRTVGFSWNCLKMWMLKLSGHCFCGSNTDLIIALAGSESLAAL